MHQRTRFADQSVGSAGPNLCCERYGANSAQKGTMHEEQRWADGQRGLRRFAAANARIQVQTDAEWLRSRAQ